jgi:hypothetical protein
MSKRGDEYQRIPRDLYKTPFKAVLPLIPYLRRDGIKRFAEPCCDDGGLVRHLESHGLVCSYAGDISTGQDALQLTRANLNRAQAIITNTPYKYPEAKSKIPHLMLDMIQHFLALGQPSWLLLQHDFLANQYLSKFMQHCSDIVVIGRVQWIPDSKHKSGFDNADWARFDARHRGKTSFFNDRNYPAQTRQPTRTPPQQPLPKKSEPTS